MRARAINSAWFASAAPSAAAFARSLRDPARAQERVLQRIIRRNAASAAGRELGFDRLDGVGSFQRSVPLRTYEDTEPWIDRIKAGRTDALTTDPPLRLLPTGGSTAGPKLIPFNSPLRREFDRAIMPWIAGIFRDHPACLGGPAYWSISPAIDTTPFGHSAVPIGFDSDTGYLARWLAPLLDAVMAAPAHLAERRNLRDFRRETLAHLCLARELRFVSVWHPSFFHLLLDALADDFDGVLEHAEKLAPGRANELNSIGPDPAALWPNLALVSAWADADAEPSWNGLRARLPGVAFQPKGLVSTEAIVSIPLAGAFPLAVRSHFFEFLGDDGRVHPAQGLREGGEYRVVVTTGAGLYRYRLDDRVRVTGFLGRTPSVRFLGRAGRVSDTRGEKLSPLFVSGALAETLSAQGVRPRAAFVGPLDDADARYLLLIDTENADLDTLASALDARLRRNPHYDLCRRLGQLGPLACVRVSRLLETYYEHAAEDRTRLGASKPPVLIPARALRRLLDHADAPFRGRPDRDRAAGTRLS